MAKTDKDDVKSLHEVMDLDKDGRATLYDLEKLVEKYLGASIS